MRAGRMARALLVCGVLGWLAAGCGNNLSGGGGADGGGGGGGGDGGGGGGGGGDSGEPWRPKDGGGPVEDDAGRPGAQSHAPTIYSTPIAAATEGKPYQYPVLAEDLDGDALTFALAAAPMGMSIDPSTGLVSFTPGPDSAGTVTVTIRASDPSGRAAEQRYDLVIAAGTEPPRILSTPALGAKAGSTYTYAAKIADPDDTRHVFTVVGPNGMTVDNQGTVTWAVPNGTAGSFPVTLTVRDEGGKSESQSFSIGVAAQGKVTPPMAAMTAPANNAIITQPTDVMGTASDPALAGYKLELCRSWTPPSCILIGQGLLPVTKGKLGTIDPKTVPDGTFDLRLTALDGAGNQSVASVIVLVKGGEAKLGAMRLAFEEFRVRAQGTEVVVNRIYDGLDLSAGPLGMGWRWEWDLGHGERPKPIQTGWHLNYIKLPPAWDFVPDYEHPLRLILPDGRTYEFQVMFEHEPGLSSIHRVRPQFIELTRTGAKLDAFVGNMVPVSLVDWDVYVDPKTGNLFTDLDLLTPWEPTAYRITTDWNEVYTFDAATGAIVKYDDGSGLVLERTKAAVRLNGKDLIRLDYAADGMVSQATDTTTGSVVKYTRDNDKNLVKAVVIDGTEQTFTYGPGSRLIGYQIPGRAPERYEYDEKGRVILHVAASGAITTQTYDDANKKVMVTDGAGNTVTTFYDASGNILKTIDPLGNARTYTWVPGTHYEASHTDPLGHTWNYQYDKQGRRSVIQDPTGAKVQLTYDPATGRATQSVDGEGRTFRETADKYGRPTAFIAPDGKTVRSFSYPDDFTVVETDARGNATTKRFDDRGRQVGQTDKAGPWSATYDDVAHTVAFKHPDGTTSRADLDKRGRMVTHDTGSGVIEYKYGNGPGLPDMVKRPDGGKTEYRKTPGGDLSQIVVDGAVVQAVRYDALGRIASVQRPDGAVSYRYDENGRLTQSSGPRGSLRYTWDAAGRMLSAATDDGRLTSFAYDAAGRTIAVDNGKGERYEAAYDRSGRIVSAVDKTGRRVQVGYDANGRRANVTWLGGLTTAWTYLPSDAADDEAPIASMTDTDGVKWTYGYGADDQIASITDPLGGKTSFERDSERRITKITDARARTIAATWTGNGLSRLSLPSGRAQSWTYDGAGRPATWTREDGTAVSYQYAGDTATQVLPGGARFNRQEKPALGVVSNWGSPGGAVTEWLDGDGRTELLQVDDGAEVAVRYLADGRLAEVKATTPGGATFVTRYVYDALGHLAQIVDPDNGTTTYSYDVAGRVTRIERPNGTRTELGWGALEAPTSVTHFRGAQIAAEYKYTYDKNGRVVGASGPAGELQYEYDALSRLAVERKVQNGATVEERKRAYDAVGNLVTLTDKAGTTTFTYDDDDRLLSSAGPAGKTTWSYSDRGALLSVEDANGRTAYEYDDLDRLIKVTGPDGKSIQYGYDAAGRRLSRSDDGGARRCLPLPITPTGYDDCAVVYSPGKDEKPEAMVFGAFGVASRHGAARRYFESALHDVVAVTDAMGATVGSADFDPWGRRLPSSSGEDPGYGFAGERHDAAAGLVFLRARWYDPRTGRFLTPDRADADGDPRDLHRYLYALANPLNREDPSGEQSLCSVSVSMNVSAVLNTISTTIRLCVYERAKRGAFLGAASFVLSSITGFFTNGVEEIVKHYATAPLPTLEAAFHQKLADLLCGRNNSQDVVGAADWQFEYRVDRCGNPINRKKQGRPNWADCASGQATKKGLSGIDIVLDNWLGIELKLANSTYDPDQLRRFCRFGARTLHIFLYGYVKFPDNKIHDQHARDCWKCWDNSGCANKTFAGSVYVAFGVTNNSDGVRFYVPGPSLCGK